MAAIPYVLYGTSDEVFAYRGGVAIKVSQFLRDVEGLARSLPDRRYILNLCADRYQFAVGFSAALLRGQISLLPPNYTTNLVERLRFNYADMYCLVDGAADFSGVEVVPFPVMSEADAVERTAQAIPEAQCAALVFTSGSTGDPVAHPKSWGSLCRGAAAEAASLNIVRHSGMAVLGTVPAQHMYGLESCMLLAMQNGLALVAERPFYPADIFAQLSRLPSPRCLVTTPVHLRTLLAEARSVPSLQFVLCATAHLSPALARQAEEQFNAPLYEIYGCTEAGMVASRRPTHGEAWQLLAGVVMQQGEQGCRVRGGHVEVEAELSDVIRLGKPGTFSLHGRVADLVNIAGKRTSLASLNHHLNEIPGVQDGVFFVQDEADGEMRRPQAFVVAPGLARDDIVSTLRKMIDPVFLPRPVYFVDTLPRNATGKLTRASLVQLAQRCANKTNRLALHFAVDHPTSAGHFPGNPIIPGALLLAEVVRLIAEDVGIRFASTEVKSAKFHHLARPGERVSIEYSVTGTSEFNFHCVVAETRVLSGAFNATLDA